MSVELVKKSLQLNKKRNRESAQVIKERDLIVPDGKPDMNKVLQIDSSLQLEQIEVQQDRIIYKGEVALNILYIPENNHMEICTMKGTIPLEDFIIVEGVDKDHTVRLNYNIEHLHWNILNERKVNVKTIIQLEVDTTESQLVNVAVDYDSTDPIQVRKKEVYFSQKSNIKEEKIIIKDDLTVPSSKSGIGEVLRTEITISDKETRRTEEEIFYSGNINIVTLYKVENDNETIEMMSHQIPFSNAIEYDRMEEEEFFDCNLEIADKYVQIVPDLDGEDRILEVEVFIKAEASTVDGVRACIIDDIYCPGKEIQITDETNDYITLIHKSEICLPKKETIIFEESAPDSEYIYSISMNPTIEETEITSGTLNISGVLDVKIVYISQELTQKLAQTRSLIPFNQQVDISGLDKESMVVVSSKADDIRILAQDKREVSTEFIICNLIEVYDKKSLYIIDNIELGDIDIEEMKKSPSMIIYTVKQGDTYWDIAKKYNTTLEEIQKVNDIDLEEDIYPGQKIMILKKANY